MASESVVASVAASSALLTSESLAASQVLNSLVSVSSCSVQQLCERLAELFWVCS